MVKRIVSNTLYTLELAQVQQLLDRSWEIDDAVALQNLEGDADLRHNVQAILDVMYRRPHGRGRITKDSLAVAKLLLGFAHDVGTQIIKGAEEQIYGTDSGNRNLDTSESPTGIVLQSTPVGDNPFAEAAEGSADDGVAPASETPEEAAQSEGSGVEILGADGRKEAEK